MTLKWRIVLATANVALAVSMCWVGLRQYESDHRMHPEYFYHGNLYYLPTAQIAIYSLNAPAYTLSTAFQDFGLRHLQRGGILFTASAFNYVYVGFFVAVASLWWWIGSRLDIRTPRSGKSTTIKRFSKLVAFILCGALSFTMAYHGYIFRHGTVIPWPIPISQMVWGIGLCTYFCVKVLRVGDLTGKAVGH